MPLTTLQDKNVFITGAASGIGLATAEAFAKRGARLFLTDINAAGLTVAKQQVEALGARCETALCDVTDAAAVAALAKRIEAEHGALHVLVNNAGVAFLGGFMEHSLDEWARTLNINVMGLVHCIRAFLPGMRAASGPRHIVNISSAAGVSPAPNMAAYAASKAAVKGFNEVLAMELDGSNVSVQCVYPGTINTPIAHSRTGANMTPAQVKRIQQHYATNGCDPRVVAEAIVKGVLAGTAHIFTGPVAALCQWLERLMPTAKRKLIIKESRKSGFLPT